MNDRSRPAGAAPEVIAATRPSISRPDSLRRRDAALLAELVEALRDVDPSVRFCWRRLKDGRLGRPTSVGTALRHYRTGRWTVTIHVVHHAELLRSEASGQQVVVELVRCSICSRPLTADLSVRLGVGPRCRGAR